MPLGGRFSLNVICIFFLKFVIYQTYLFKHYRIKPWQQNQQANYFDMTKTALYFRQSPNSYWLGPKAESVYYPPCPSVCVFVCLCCAKHTLLVVIDTFGQRNNSYIGLGWHNLKRGLFFTDFLFVLVWFGSWTSLQCIMGELAGHSRFRTSVNCGAPSMENRFQVANFNLKSERLPVFFSGWKWAWLTWVACIGLRERFKWSLGCARSFLEAFLDLS